MRGGLGNLMKQAQAMQDNLKRAQEQVAALEVEGSAGGGAVKVRLTGAHRIKRVTIDPKVMDDREMLEDLVTLAVNDAAAQIEVASAKLMSGVTGGMALPPGMKLPF